MVAVQRTLQQTILISLLGLVIAQCLNTVEINNSKRLTHNIFFHLFVRFEPVVLVAVIVLGCFLIFGLSRLTKRLGPGQWHQISPLARPSRYWQNALGLAVATFLFCWFGYDAFMSAYPLSMDEYLMEFQAKALHAGHMFGAIPEEWQGFANALSPIYTVYDAENNRWIQQYIPVFAMIYAVAGGLTGPLLNALSILCLFLISRRLFPSNSLAQLLPMVLLATSTQFLITGMTIYTMSGHLAFNLLWLYLYTRDDRTGITWLPVVGILAMGLHKPHIHFIFALPFFIRMLRRYSWGALAWVVGVYLIGCAYTFWWIQITSGVTSQTELSAGDVNQTPWQIVEWALTRASLGAPGVTQIIVRLINLIDLITWLNLAAFVFTLSALTRWRSMTPIWRDITLSIIFTFVFFLFFKGTGGHGWGSRYSHSIIGLMCLLAVWGWQRLPSMKLRYQGFLLIAICTVFSVFIELPVRAWQVSAFTAPYARTWDHLQTLPEDILIIETRDGYYSQDFVRNHPCLANEKRILFGHRMNQKQLAQLETMGQVRIIGAETFARFGIPLIDWQLPANAWLKEEGPPRLKEKETQP